VRGELPILTGRAVSTEYGVHGVHGILDVETKKRRISLMSCKGTVPANLAVEVCS